MNASRGVLKRSTCGIHAVSGQGDLAPVPINPVAGMIARPAIILSEPAGIPADLRAMLAWIGWRLEQREGRWSKVPVNLKTGKAAKSNDPSTWCDFTTALEAYQRRNCSGLGLCRTEDLIFIDLDGCLDSTGELRPYSWAQGVVDALQGRAYF